MYVWLRKGFIRHSMLKVCEAKFLMNLNRVKHSRANVKIFFQVSRIFLWINLNMNYLRMNAALPLSL